MIIGHGGNIYEAAKQLGCSPADIIDMSSNMNPLGPIEGMVKHIVENMDTMTSLPDAGAVQISTLFAEKYNLDPSHVLAGNGSTQFIYSLPLALKTHKALISGPTYADYADACSMHGVPHEHITAEEEKDFNPDIDGISGKLENYDTVFICNPNNPTGALIHPEEIKQICESYPDKWFIVDESYLPFVFESESYSMLNSGIPNVIVLNSMSKIYRIPGLRVGFLIGPDTVIKRMLKYMLPWSVNCFAQSAVMYLMTHHQEVNRFVSKTRKFIDMEMKNLIRMFSHNKSIKLYPSTTGFVLVRLVNRLTADYVCRALIQNRILIRDCSNFVGLSKQYIRISLKTSEINKVLGEKLNEVTRGE